MQKVFFTVSLSIAILVVLVGCGKTPEAEIERANSAMQNAQMAEAESYAPQTYQAAKDTLNAAQAAQAEQDGKFALFRSYGKAEALYLSAEALANQAVTEAQAEKERVKVEVSDLLVQAKAAVESAEAALKKAPKGKGSKADIELIKNDLASTSATYQGAMDDFNAGKYLVAKTKAEAVIAKANTIIEEIARATAAKTTRSR